MSVLMTLILVVQMLSALAMIGLVLRRRLTITGSTLRPRPVEFKGRIAASLKQTVWPWLESKTIVPVIHSVFEACVPVDGYPSGAARAHALMESNQHVGKIVITWGNP